MPKNIPIGRWALGACLVVVAVVAVAWLLASFRSGAPEDGARRRESGGQETPTEDGRGEGAAAADARAEPRAPVSPPENAYVTVRASEVVSTPAGDFRLTREPQRLVDSRHAEVRRIAEAARMYGDRHADGRVAPASRPARREGFPALPVSLQPSTSEATDLGELQSP